MERKELFVSDLSEVFEPKSALSDIGANDKWRTVFYENTICKGKLLASLGTGCPEDISYDPKLTGWYKIYVTFPCFTGFRLLIKLTSDESFLNISNQRRHPYTMEETLWRCADMTDQTITLSRKQLTLNINSGLAALRFVPMSDEEVAAYKNDIARKDTKRLYATDDMHNRLYDNNMTTLDRWLSTIDCYADSDVEWFSPEEIRVFTDGKCPVDPDDYAYFREGDRNLQKQKELFSYDDILRTVTEKAHRLGIKVAPSLRMAAWGLEYPYDQTYYDCPFLYDHPEWFCVDRSGEKVTVLSYVYPEVRKYLIDILVNSARCGADAVNLIGHRGVPYVLYEKPVADMFFERYGEYPYELPLDEPRLRALHCEIMTGFFRELRAALDAEFGKDKVAIHLRCQYSIEDSAYVGFDMETLAKEGLINAIISYPQRFYEFVPASIRRDDDPTRIDLKKYDAYIHTDDVTVRHSNDFDHLDPYENSRGELVGPATLADRVKEWTDLGDKYGLKVYFEIFPRTMPNADFKRKALDLYRAGAENIALWDTFGRVPQIALWNLVRKLGHKDEVEGYDPFMNEYKTLRVLKYAESNINRYRPMWGG